MTLRKKISLPGLILLTALLFPLTSCAAATALVKSANNEERAGLELTVYNDNFALIRDARNLRLKAGTARFEFTGVPATVIPETILLRPLDADSGLTILEQSFNYDILNKKSLLDRYVGKKIRLERRNKFNDRVSTVEATLLSNSPEPIYQIGDEIYIGHSGIPVLPELPKGLLTTPRISWLYSAPRPGVYRLEATYLAEKIKWEALYQLVLKGDSKSGKLRGWVNLSNESGTAFKDARMRFAAGKPHRVTRSYRVRGTEAGGAFRMFSETQQAVQSPLFEYHVYDIKRKISIKNNEQKQLSLFTAQDISVKKEFELRGRPGYFRAPLRAQKTTEPVYVYLKFTNSKANSLGMPLPAGIVRIYMEGNNGELEFVGEDKIDHTPDTREVRLKAGRAFDVTANRRQTGYKRISSVLYDTEWEIKLRNNKAHGVAVNIIEPLPGAWEILSSSLPYTKIDAFTIRFEVPVPAGKEVRVTYRARVKM